MSKCFDDLFNEFLGGGLNNKKEDNKPKNLDFNIEDLIKTLSMDVNADDLSNLSDFYDFNGGLGEPSEIKHYEEDGLFFEERIWETKNGAIRKLIVTDESLIKKFNVGLSLEDELEAAIKCEDYEKAAKIRDLINEEKKK